jgi:hypothetical protein
MLSLVPDPVRLSEEGAAALAAEAMRLVSSGQVVGLGTGQAATAFVRALGQRVAAGLDVRRRRRPPSRGSSASSWSRSRTSTRSTSRWTAPTRSTRAAI